MSNETMSQPLMYSAVVFGMIASDSATDVLVESDSLAEIQHHRP